MNKNMKKSGMGIVLIVLILLLAACGSNSDNSSGSPETGASAAQPSESAPSAQSSESAPPEQSAEATAGFPRDIDGAFGTVTLEKKPLKVGVANWMLLELLLPFDLSEGGITLPFSAANSSLESDIYKEYADKFDDLKIVGENTQVNLEAMLAFQPDVIIAGSVSNKEIRQQLEQIAPTAWYDEEKINVRNDWTELMTFMGGVLGQEERAQQLINDFHTKQSEGKEELAGRSDETVMLVQVRENAVYAMSYGSIPQYYDGLGLTPPDAVKEMGGPTQISLEGLTVIDPDHLFLGYFNLTDTSLAALTDEWQDSEVWKGLKAVKNNQVYPFNGELALGIGPIGQAYGIDTVIKALE